MKKSIYLKKNKRITISKIQKFRGVKLRIKFV